YADGFCRLTFRPFGLFYLKTGEPFARRRSRDGQTFDFPLKRTMQLDFHLTNLREFQVARLQSKARLRVGERVIATARAKARKSGFAILQLDAPEEISKCLVQSPQHLLQDLRMNSRQLRTILFDFWQLVLLLRIGNRFSRYLISVASFLQRGIIQLA